MADTHTGMLAARPRFAPLGGGGVCVAAPAKINLDLHVGPRRADGYHDLDSLVAKVTLYDQVLLRPRQDGRIELVCSGADCGPADRNLALRAARLLAEHAPRPVGGADICLVKAVPPGAGLGGGSSDAAAALAGLNRLWGLHLPAQRLADLGARLGSDVPLFLGPPTARMTGRGEMLRPMPVHPFVAVLHMPDLACPTAEVYAAFDRIPAAETSSPARPAPPELAASPPSAWRDRLRNDLAPAARKVCPGLADVHARLADAARLPVGITGSGSALFVLCDGPAEASGVLARLPADLPGRTVLVGPNPW